MAPGSGLARGGTPADGAGMAPGLVVGNSPPYGLCRTVGNSLLYERRGTVGNSPPYELCSVGEASGV